MLPRKYRDANFVRHEPCEVCGSRDNKAVYDDGSSYCFSCKKRRNMEGQVIAEEPKYENTNFVTGECTELTRRNISEKTCQHYNYQKGFIGEESVQIANYMENGIVIAQKIRDKSKVFKWWGNTSILYGQWVWEPNKKWDAPLIITEGEIDCLSIAQAFNLSRPVVSITKGCGGAVKNIKDNYEYIDSFPSVILCFDSDEAGQDALLEVAPLIKPGKCSIATLPVKDANELLSQNRTQDLVNAIYNAKPYKPEGVVTGDAIWEEVIKDYDDISIPYPFPKLNEMTHGIRCGEIVTITAGTGIGKSQFCREVAFNSIKEGKKVAYYALEENTRRSALGIMSLQANKPLHLVSKEAIDFEEWKRLYEEINLGEKIVFDKAWGSDKSLTGKLRYFIKGLDCNLIILDHISIVISGDSEGDERRKIDNLMTNLRDFVEETQCAMLLVSHLKRNSNGRGHEDGGQVSISHLRGSQTIAQLSDMVIGLERDQQGDDRDITTVRVLKNRYSGEQGEAGKLRYRHETGRMFEVLDEEVFEDEEDTTSF